MPYGEEKEYNEIIHKPASHENIRTGSNNTIYYYINENT